MVSNELKALYWYMLKSKYNWRVSSIREISHGYAIGLMCMNHKSPHPTGSNTIIYLVDNK